MQKNPLKIAATYALVGALWILLSDQLIHFLVADHTLSHRLLLFKGWAFIAVTAVILYKLIARDHVKIRRSVAIAREGEQLLHNVLETLPVGVWLLDRQGTITYGNPAGQKIWGGARFVKIEQLGDYKGWWLATGKKIVAQEWGGARAIREGQTSLDEEINTASFVTPSPQAGGFGLFSIREGLHYLGGEMAIDSSPGSGTRVTLAAPVQESIEEGDTP